MAFIQFIKGVNETQIPLVKLTRSKQGTTGTATFFFEDPDVFKKIEKDTKITAMYLIDDDYQFVTKDIRAKFIDGKPKLIVAVCVLTSSESWDLFFNFMETYANKHSLIFSLDGAFGKLDDRD